MPSSRLSTCLMLGALVALPACEDDRRPPPPPSFPTNDAPDPAAPVRRNQDAPQPRPSNQRPATQDPELTPHDRALRVLADAAMANKGAIVIIPRGAANAIQAELENRSIEATVLKDWNNNQYFAQQLISRVRWKNEIWLVLDHTDTKLCAVLEEFFFADQDVRSREKYGDVTIFHVTNALAEGLSAGRQVSLTKLTRPGGMITDIRFTKSDETMFTAAKHGVVRWYAADNIENKRGDLIRLPIAGDTPGVFQGGESGLIGLALHPEFEAGKPLLYIHYNWAEQDGSREARVSEWPLTKTADGGYEAGTERILFRTKQTHDNHNGGSLVFGADGYLYIGVGDGEQGKWLTGRSPAAGMRGKILRIDPEEQADGSPYGIPEDNPFLGHAEIPPEAWAWGFRNPWRMAFTPDGRLVVGEIGEDRNEELTFAVRGRHHGWPYTEGRFKRLDWTLDGIEPQPPIHVYGRHLGMSVIGGRVFTGDRVPALTGKYVFCDYMSGRMWAFDLPDGTDEAVELGDLVELGRWAKLFTTFGNDHAGNLYVGDHAGNVYRIDPPSADGNEDEFELAELDPEMARRLFAGEPPQPERDDVTPDEIELGQILFADARISGDGRTACVACHPLDKFGQDGRPTSPGLERNAPPLFNAHRQFAQFRDYRAESVEDAAMISLLEHNGLGTEAEVERKLAAAPEYADRFAAAFPDAERPVTAEHAARALGAFIRQLETRSRWDEFIAGNDKALSQIEQTGLAEFIAVGCTSCHMYRSLGGGMAQKLGLNEPWTGDDPGHAAVSGDAGQKHFFKVSPLWNVEKTGPYYHDGSIATLQEAVRHMAKAQLGRDLKPAQVRAIVAFLRALTGEFAPPR